jgi:hypothetical protein
MQKGDRIKYTDFPDLLYHVRYEIAVSQMMETNIGAIEAIILEEFLFEDRDRNGLISVH